MMHPITIPIVLASMMATAAAQVTFLTDHATRLGTLDPTDVAALPGGDLLICGALGEGSGPERAWLARCDPSGRPLWHRAFASPAGGLRAVSLTAVTAPPGKGPRYAMLLEVDSGRGTGLVMVTGSGQVVRSQLYNASDGALALTRLIEVATGGFLMVGSVGAATTGRDVVLVSVGGRGRLRWSRSFAGPGTAFDSGYGLRAAGSGCGLFVTGTLAGAPWLARLDAHGGLVFERSYTVQISGSIAGRALDVLERGANDLVLLGSVTTRLNNLDNRPFFFATDGNGVPSTPTASSFAMGTGDIVLTRDGGFAVVGYRKQPLGVASLVAARYDASLNLLWSREYSHILTLAQFALPPVAGAETAAGGLLLAADPTPLPTAVLLSVDPSGRLGCASSGYRAETSVPVSARPPATSTAMPRLLRSPLELEVTPFEVERIQVCAPHG